MERKKSFRKVRCVNPKTNAIKYIPEHLVEELCLTYGLIEQDLEEKSGNPYDAKTVREQYEELTGKKAGNRKDETLLKEIEALNK